jgi:oxygen-independent coproporphyrinogen-3 oxidase
MYALPRQTVPGSLADLEQALELGPAHLSHYQLTLEHGTVFERRPPPLPDDESAWAMQVACQERLAAAGYRQYEVSAYATAARECRHNLNYWRFGDYLGIGAGAHGKLTDPGSGRILRAARVRQPGRYLAATAPAGRLEESRVVAEADLPFEFFLNALRLVDGFAAVEFEQRTGLSWASVASRVAMAEQRGLLRPQSDGRWATTSLGRRFLNDLHAGFLPDSPRQAPSRRFGDLASAPEIG